MSADRSLVSPAWRNRTAPARSMTTTVAAGKRADFVVLDADPAADAANWRRLRTVVRNGRAHAQASLLPAPARAAAR